MPDPADPPLARALGRIPSGLYIVSTVRDGRPVGFLGSFVMQMGFEPPTVFACLLTTWGYLRFGASSWPTSTTAG